MIKRRDGDLQVQNHRGMHREMNLE